MNYITTTLFYSSGLPHLGHALELVQADVLARYFKFKKGDDNVFFNSGLDEHGLKVYQAAIDNGLKPQEHCDKLNDDWQSFYKLLFINPDNFYRTTSEQHKEGVQKIWNILLEKGDIYKKDYTSKYCLGCEEFKRDLDLVEGKCSVHTNKDLEEVSEENYFFRLTKYNNSLLEWFDTSDFLTTNRLSEELRNYILNAKDFSISRLKTSVPWGVEVPNDSDQTVYVWFCALCNYILSAEYLSEDFKWENTLQICGPDNIRFQGLIFQAFLKALDIPQTDKLLVHGTILDQSGKKMSKSIGNVIDPVEIINKYGQSALRYYLIIGLPTTSNSNYEEDELVSIYNAQLCNSFGNLVKRVNTLIDKLDVEISDRKVDSDWIEDINNIIEKNIDIHFEKFELQKAYLGVNGLIDTINKHFTETAPWNCERKLAEHCLNVCYWTLNKILPYYEFLIPEKAVSVRKSLEEFDKNIVLFERLE